MIRGKNLYALCNVCKRVTNVMSCPHCGGLFCSSCTVSRIILPDKCPSCDGRLDG